MEEEAAQLEMDLAAKETETLNVLRELETTKVILEELEQKLQEGGNSGGESPGSSESKRSLGNELAGVRAAIESCKEKVEEERFRLEETGQRLFSKSSKASSLEEELKETKTKQAAARRVKRAEEELRESKKALEEAASRVEGWFR
ncbi:unnamed protein product [Cuscuta campestris]|uniref:Uncharacterized protein n=1 Tax=Cuscuta campestris TaxID=132261 RepID=A0A484MKB2_9ASTE|nr:unnamed protein product [Cuscuta campestris]